MYKMSNKGNDTKINKWSYVGCVRAHTHDVKSLVVSVPITSQGMLTFDFRYHFLFTVLLLYFFFNEPFLLFFCRCFITQGKTK